MTDKVTNIQDEREPTLPAAKNAAAVPPETIAQTAHAVPSESMETSPGAKADDDSMMEAELPVVAKVPAPKIERTEEQMRQAALVASQEWHGAAAPQGDFFSRPTSPAQSPSRQFFNGLDRRPMPPYKPGEPLDPLLEL